jgi:hypothetical protein
VQTDTKVYKASRQKIYNSCAPLAVCSHTLIEHIQDNFGHFTKMKALSLVLAVVATASAAAIPEQQAQAPDPPAVKPYGLPDIISAGMAALQYLQKVITDAGGDLQKGKAISDVVGETVPKIFPEAKMLTKINVEGQKLRTNSVKARAQFGPYSLVGKNAS